MHLQIYHNRSSRTHHDTPTSLYCCLMQLEPAHSGNMWPIFSRSHMLATVVSLQNLTHVKAFEFRFLAAMCGHHWDNHQLRDILCDFFFLSSTAGSSKLDKEPARVSASTQRPLSPYASFFVHLTHAEGGGLTESDHMSHRPQPLPLQAAGPEIWEFPYRNQWWLYCCRSHPWTVSPLLSGSEGQTKHTGHVQTLLLSTPTYRQQLCAMLLYRKICAIFYVCHKMRHQMEHIPNHLEFNSSMSSIHQHCESQL